LTDEAQNRDYWRALMNTVMKLPVSQKEEELLAYLSNYTASESGLCFMEMVR
jgi:DNA-directed RNA polymerase specialized sigma24 family protein